MKAILLTVVIFYVSQISAKFSVRKIDEVHGAIKKIHCNSFNFNCYVLTSVTVKGGKEKQGIYKINSDKKIGFMKEDLRDTVNMYVNKNDDVYLVSKYNKKGPLTPDFRFYKFSLKKDKWENFMNVHSYYMHVNKSLKILIDKNNYFYFTNEYGPVFLKPDLLTPIQFYTNENEYEFKSFETDSKGNVYFKIKIAGESSDSFLQMTKESKKQKILGQN